MILSTSRQQRSVGATLLHSEGQRSPRQTAPATKTTAWVRRTMGR